MGDAISFKSRLGLLLKNSMFAYWAAARLRFLSTSINMRKLFEIARRTVTVGW